VEETGPSHLGGMGSGVEGSDSNVEARSGAGVDDGAGMSGTPIRAGQSRCGRPDACNHPYVQALVDRTLEGTYLNVLTSVLQWSYHKFSIRTTVRVSLLKPVYNI
jgi:hypothetical protein